MTVTADLVSAFAPTGRLRAAKVVHEATYTTQVHTHSALEPHAIVVAWEGEKKLRAWCSTQGIFSVRDELAEIFDLKKSDVHVTTEFLGGGFGGDDARHYWESSCNPARISASVP